MSDSALDGATVLVIDDETATHAVFRRLLGRHGGNVLATDDPAEGLRIVAAEPVDLVVTDLRMPAMDGLEVLARVRAIRPALPVVVVTAFASTETAVEALRAGALDYIPKPFNHDYVVHRLTQALERQHLVDELRDLRRALSERPYAGTLLGGSAEMSALVALVGRVAALDIPLLVTGETGTGKELVAREVHRSSRRAAQPFLAINCGAIAGSLLESELFGHVKGAFTGATADHAGYFEAARGGTLLLDEVAETPPAVQVKLLRVLEAREVLPVGATVPRPVDVRVVAATHRDLPAAIAEGRFREDLYYRLNVVSLAVPPLRSRPMDVPLLATHFLERCAETLGTRARRFDADALGALVAYGWPGNVRELRNVVTRAAALSDGETLGLDALPANVAGSDGEGSGGFPTLERVERRHIARALELTGGRRAEAAALLGIDRATLYRKLKRAAE